MKLTYTPASVVTEDIVDAIIGVIALINGVIVMKREEEGKFLVDIHLTPPADHSSIILDLGILIGTIETSRLAKKKLNARVKEIS